MDTFAALALASERPHPSIIRTPPTKEGELVMTRFVWRQIYGIALWNVLVIATLLVLGKSFWGLKFNRSDPFVLDTSTSLEVQAGTKDKLTMYSIIFETFVFL